MASNCETSGAQEMGGQGVMTDLSWQVGAVQAEGTPRADGSHSVPGLSPKWSRALLTQLLPNFINVVPTGLPACPVSDLGTSCRASAWAQLPGLCHRRCGHRASVPRASSGPAWLHGPQSHMPAFLLPVPLSPVLSPGSQSQGTWSRGPIGEPAWKEPPCGRMFSSRSLGVPPEHTLS